MSNWQFLGYVARSTAPGDLSMLKRWTDPPGRADFWLKQGKGRETYLVSKDDFPIGVFQVEHVKADQVRLHFQAVCRHPKKILRAITRLVPLIEQGLRLRGVTAIFFTSHSPAMVTFMQKLGYTTKMEWGTLDGQVMAKQLGRQNVGTKLTANPATK